MSRAIHFEIHATNIDSVVKFYSQVFNWSIKKWDGPVDYWLVTTGSDDKPGINGAIMKRQTESPKGNEPINGYVCTMNVGSIDETIKKIESNGGTIVLAKQAIPNIGFLAYAKDPDGNIFGIMSEDTNAK